MTHRLSPRLALLFGALALTACSSSPPAPPPPSEATLTAHVDAATRAAGLDLQALLPLCRPDASTRPSQEAHERMVEAALARPAPPPGRAFDNLFYVGSATSSAWAIHTAGGIILIDALNNRDEAAALIETGLRRVGLDPSQIRYVIVTHGHGDHYGGVSYLAQRYQPRIVMSAIDWQMTENAPDLTSRAWERAPRFDPARDVGVADGSQIVLGDTGVVLYLTPGHTPGTLTPVFEVTSGGRLHRVMLWGGVTFNFGKDIPRLESYIASTQRMRTVAQELGIDVFLTNHPAFDGSLTKLAQQQRQGSMQPNPFVIGAPAVERVLTVLGECAQAARDRFVIQAPR